MAERYCINDHTGKFLIEFSNYYLEENPAWGAHIHHFLEISWVKKGTGIYYIDEKTYDVREGDIFIISNTETHRLVPSGSGLLINSVVHFEPEFIWSVSSTEVDYQFLQIFFERNETFSNRLDRENTTTGKIYNLLEELEQEFIHQLPAYPMMVKIKLQTVFAEIVRNYGYLPAKHSNTRLTDNGINELCMVTQFIDIHIAEDIKLQDLANLVHRSPTYFSSFFKRYYHMSPFEYIVSKRIQRAVEYIVSTRKTFTEIATLCGFNNTTNFNKAFKKVTGHSPSYYR